MVQQQQALFDSSARSATHDAAIREAVTPPTPSAPRAASHRPELGSRVTTATSLAG